LISKLDPIARNRSLCRWSGWWLAYFFTTIIANRLGPAKPRDRVEGSRRLGDRLARPAAELLPHMLGHEPLPRDYIECLDDILANLGALPYRPRL